MKFLLSSFLFFSAACISAQIGFNFRYGINKYDKLTEILALENNDKVFNESFEIGVDYWKRLKNHRIEFFPQLAFSYAKTNLDQTELEFLEQKGLLFLATTRFYFLDLVDDCDCPTFSKQGNWFTKGFFIFVSPGLSWNKFGSSVEDIQESKVGWNIGIGGGLDFGFNDYITITPSIQYRLHNSLSWNSLGNHIGSIPLEFTPSQILFGIRVGLRFDYLNNSFN